MSLEGKCICSELPLLQISIHDSFLKLECFFTPLILVSPQKPTLTSASQITSPYKSTHPSDTYMVDGHLDFTVRRVLLIPFSCRVCVCIFMDECPTILPGLVPFQEDASVIWGSISFLWHWFGGSSINANFTSVGICVLLLSSHSQDHSINNMRL